MPHRKVINIVNVFMLMMGGSGTRFGADRPKQYTLVRQRPLFSFITEKADSTEVIHRIVVVSHKDWLDYVSEWCEKTIHRVPYSVVAGGATRSESVLNGLRSMEAVVSAEDVVMIHDATHPYLDPEAVRMTAEAAALYGGATVASKNYDTVYRTDESGFLEKVEPRELIVAGASPEAFQYGRIYPIYRDASDDELSAMTSAGAIALAHRIPMKVIPTSVLNLKITYPPDMNLFLQLADQYFFPPQS